MVKISLVNKSTVVSDTDLVSLAQALQIQISRDFYPEYGKQAQVYWTPSGHNPTAGHWVLGLFDNSDVPGALGFHDETPDGLPMGKVFAKTTIDDGGLVSVTASHEILEMIENPDVNLDAEVDDGSGNPLKIYFREVGDPVEADADGYDIDVPANFTGGPAKIRVSDFVTRAWFESFNTIGPFSFMKRVNAPFTLSPGGYFSVLDLSNLGAGWQQVMHQDSSPTQRAAARPRPGSRRARHALRRSEWLTSTYTPGNATPFQAEAV